MGISEHLGVRLSPEPTSPVRPTRYAGVDILNLVEFDASTTLFHDNSVVKSASFLFQRSLFYCVFPLVICDYFTLLLCSSLGMVRPLLY